ncbi:MAG: hypothetical protein QOF76_5268 [Solirubrobacteraceae bacterium]|nr:hypothetical protein [Solirubrobacteraceae bacterium]
MTTFEERTGPITRTQIVRFAGAGGDFNPMHHDEQFARAAGQPTVFAMGQLPAAIMAAAVGRWLGRETIAGYGVRFREKVWPGDQLVLRGRLVDGTDGCRSCELEARRVSDDTVVMTGWVRAGGPSG